MKYLAVVCAIALFCCAKAVGAPPTYAQFVTLDASGHFVNEHGAFVGYGTNYNQIYGGSRRYGVSEYDMTLMQSDLASLASRGFTHVVLRVFWGLYADPATRPTALARWQQALDLVEASGLYAVVWFDPANSWPSSLPGDERYDVIVSDARWSLFLDHVCDVVTRYKDRKCVLGWRSENESLAIHWETVYAQHPELLARFQSYLSAKYGVISALNSAWGASYASFAAVPLPVDNTDPLLMEYNYFREAFIAERNQTLAAAIRQIDPDHLTLISGIGSVGGPSVLFEHHNLDRFTNFDILGNGQYPGDFSDGAFSISHQSVLHYLRTVRPFASFGFPPMITEVSIWDDPAGVRVSDQQMVDWILSHWLDCVGEGGVGMDIWDNLLIAYDNYLSNTGTPNPDTLPLREIERFITALDGVDLLFRQPDTDVLLLRNKAVNYSNSSPWRDLGNYLAVGDWLYQLHIPFDVRSEANIDAALLENYKAVIICAQTQLYDDSVWATLRGWAEGASGRVLVNGLYSPQDARFRSKAICGDMKYLMGLAGTTYATTWHGVDGAPLDFVFAQSFGELPAGSRVPFTMYAHTWDIPTPLAATADVIAERSDKAGVPLLIRNTLPNDNTVYTFGVPTGFVWWALGANVGPNEHDGMVPIYRRMLADADVTPPFDAPTSLGVFLSDDASVILLKERYAEATDAVLTAYLAGALYDVAACTVSSSGTVTLHEEMRPHGWRVVKRLPVTIVPDSGETRVTLGDASTASFEATFSGSDTVTVYCEALDAASVFPLRVDASAGVTVNSDVDGMLSFVVPAGEHDIVLDPSIGMHTVWVRFPYSGPERGTEPEPFNTLGEAVTAAVPQATIKAEAGTFPETLRATKALRIEAVGGAARIGGAT